MNINKRKIRWDDLGAWAEIASLKGEHHVMLHVEPRRELFDGQWMRLCKAEKLLLGAMNSCAVVFKRIFLSDILNQKAIAGGDAECSVSMLQQVPLDGSKVAMWMYLTDKERDGVPVKVSHENGFTVVREGDTEHFWKMGMTRGDAEGSYQQTEALLVDYEADLEKYGMTMEGNTLRTWFFVRDVDTLYRGLVEARRDFFESHGMRADTHYIASTGIGGTADNPESIHMLDAYSVKVDGGQPRQRYLSALTHLNPTHEYGVTFERGTMLSLDGRDIVFISGTASIDNRGQVVHVGDVYRQTLRMWENVEALLKDAGAEMDDMMQIIVYLRDVADYALVSEMFEERFPDVPKVIVLAPVCRPQWLIEMECIAMK